MIGMQSHFEGFSSLGSKGKVAGILYIRTKLKSRYWNLNRNIFLSLSETMRHLYSSGSILFILKISHF